VVRRIGNRSLLGIEYWVLVSGDCWNDAENKTYEKEEYDKKIHVDGLVMRIL
jgi:hypothetical protein